VLGDQLGVANATGKRVVILGRAGKPVVRIPSGATRTWHDGRLLGTGDPPPPAAGASEAAPRFVRNWRIPGRVGGRAFAVEGSLAWVPPPPAEEEAGGAAALVAVSAAGAYLVGRGRP
jgi:hypothetical protein